MKKLKDLLSCKIFVFVLFAAGIAGADTIYTNDGSEVKGVVLEEYEDRVAISTAEGERAVLKSDIKELYYDDEEKTYLKLAEKARDRRDYETSFAYYEKAVAKNPDSKDAQAGLAYLQQHIYAEDEGMRQDFIKRHNLSDSGVEGALAVSTKEDAGLADIVRDTTGLTLAEQGSVIVMSGVDKSSSAYEAGIREGDILVALWTKLVSYMPLDRIIFTLAKSKVRRIECTIERTLALTKLQPRIIANQPSLIGATLGIKREGLTVLEVNPKGPARDAGLREGDIVIAIDGKQTRYMPLRLAVRLIKDPKEREVKFAIQRSVAIVRKSDTP